MIRVDPAIHARRPTPTPVAECLARLRRAADVLGRPVRFMEVCGTHTVNAFRSGLHSLVPPSVTLLSGPGCPVCVTALGDIDQLIGLATRPGVTLCTYGDMLRVRGSEGGSLELARATDGADVRVIYSALDAVRVARAEPGREVVLAAVGFETTAPATAAAALEAGRLGLTNFSAWTSHKLVLPAMRALLEAYPDNVDGFLCPGHVAVIIGSAAFTPVVTEFRRPCVVAGFEGPQIAAALARLAELAAAGEAALENLYPQAVDPAGNVVARHLMRKVFTPAAAMWRGLGTLPASGLQLRTEFARFDARRRFGLPPSPAREPAGCRCGEVITGRAAPADCRLFGTACTPVHAIGPCMVSSEGTCQAWFKYRRAAPARRVRAGGVRPAVDEPRYVTAAAAEGLL
jgi:hydrogenase expression/formation protein HypD